jgi:hypothetical protein
LANVYRALNLDVPPELAQSILKNAQEGDIHERPSNALEVTLDGEVTSAFEWMGAGRFRPDPRSGAMHGGGPPAREMFYGFREGKLFVRLDGPAHDAKFTVEFDEGKSATHVATGRVVELSADVSGQRFRVLARRNGLAPATLPVDGWIDC